MLLCLDEEMKGGTYDRTDIGRLSVVAFTDDTDHLLISIQTIDKERSGAELTEPSRLARPTTDARTLPPCS